MPRMRLLTLGELRLLDGSAELLPGRRKNLALLVYLARRSPRTVPRAELAALMWGERDDERARHSLSQALLELRRALGAALEATPERIGLSRGALELDVAALEAELAAGRNREAVARWKGEFLPGAEGIGGETFRAWVEGERAELHRRLAMACEALASAAAADGLWDDAASWAGRWADAAPHSEAAHARWVESLWLAGHADAALARHEAFTSHLFDLDTEPSPGWRRLGAELGRRAVEARVWVGSAALFTPDLVGRGAELAELGAAFRSARDGGAGAVVVVDGEEGIGKTRLCEEFLRTLADGEIVVLRARGDGGGPWAAAMELFAPLSAAPGLGGAPDGALATLERIVPAIRERFPRLTEPAAGDDALGAAAIRVLGDVAAEAPVVIVLDDADAADPATRGLVVSLARAVPPAVLLILATRSGALATASGVVESLDAPRLRRLKLQPLGPVESEALVASMLELEAPERRALATRLHAETGGNPFFISETIAALVDEGLLALGTDGRWRVDPQFSRRPLPIPGGVREAVSGRIARLGEPARVVLRQAAVGARTVDVGELAAAAGLPAGRFREGLDELLSRRLLRHDPDDGGGVRFTHDLVRRLGAEVPARVSPRRRVALAAALLIGLAVVAWSLRPADAALPVVAVGAIQDRTASDSSIVSQVLPGLLASRLAAIPDLRVISGERMHEVRALLVRAGGADPPSAAAVARAAGAEELIQGALYRRPAGGYRLELRRVELPTGFVLETNPAEGAAEQELVDDAAAMIAAAYGRTPPTPVAEPSSLVARRLYEEGLDAFSRRDWSTAYRLFAAAVAEDSTMAMAAYYAWQSRKASGQRVAGDTALVRAARLAATTVPERERLLIRAYWAEALEDPGLFAVAESLATRYPLEPDGHLLLGRAYTARGDFLEAIPRYLRVIELDSLDLATPAARCRACSAYMHVVNAYALMDSTEAEERLAREWVRRQPRSPGPWRRLASVLLSHGRYDDALAAERRAASLEPDGAVTPIFRAGVLLRAADREGADRILRESIPDRSPDAQADARWWLAISLREQGRLREALEEAREYRRLVAAAHRSRGFSDADPPYTAVIEAQVLLEAGRARAAAALFDSIARAAVVPESPGWTGRAQSWVLTHKATALAAAGDTAALAPLADSVLRIGARSGFGRDWKLHHYVRGVLLARRGRAAEAERELRKAVYSLRGGLSRINLELARVLVELDRPEEAVAVIRPTLERGPLEASNLYVTRTELHLEMGRALALAGRPEEAAEHYRWVLRAWSRADPELEARRADVRTRLAAIEGR